jgi:hypothetical protein
MSGVADGIGDNKFREEKSSDGVKADIGDCNDAALPIRGIKLVEMVGRGAISRYELRCEYGVFISVSVWASVKRKRVCVQEDAPASCLRHDWCGAEGASSDSLVQSSEIEKSLFII